MNPSAAAATPAAFAGLGHIKMLARWVRALCLLGLLLCLLLPLLLWGQPDWLAQVVRQDWGVGAQLPLQLDARSRLLGLLANALPAALLATVLYQVWALFGRYANGQVWCLQSVAHLRRAALALSALAPSLPLAKTLSLLALTLGNPPGQRVLQLSFALQDYLTLLLGLVLLAIASVLREAVRVAAENAEFV